MLRYPTLLLFLLLNTAVFAQTDSAQFNRAQKLFAAMQWKTALQTYDSLPATWNNNVMVLDRKAKCHRELGEYIAALALQDQALAIRPTAITVLNHRAEVYFLLGKYRSAITDNLSVLKLDPQNKWALGFLSDGYYRLSKPDSSIYYSNLILSFRDTDSGLQAAAHQNIAMAYCDKHDYANALVHCDKAIASDSTDSREYLLKATVLYEQGKYSAALTPMNKAIRLTSNDGHYYYVKAQILGKLLKQDEACKTLQKGIALNDPDCIDLSSRWCGAQNNTKAQPPRTGNSEEIRTITVPRHKKLRPAAVTRDELQKKLNVKRCARQEVRRVFGFSPYLPQR